MFTGVKRGEQVGFLHHKKYSTCEFAEFSKAILSAVPKESTHVLLFFKDIILYTNNASPKQNCLRNRLSAVPQDGSQLDITLSSTALSSAKSIFPVI